MLYIVTLNEMKADLGIQDSRDDAQLTRWLEGLQARFSDFIGYSPKREEDVVELHDGGRRFLYLGHSPLESVATIHVSSDQEWTDANLVSASDYRINLTRGYVGYGTSGTDVWPAGFQNIRVVFTGGYVAIADPVADGQHAMPEAIRRAMMMQAGFEWRNRTTLGITSFGANGATKQAGNSASLVLKGKTLLPEVEESLSPFVRYA